MEKEDISKQEQGGTGDSWRTNKILFICAIKIIMYEMFMNIHNFVVWEEAVRVIQLQQPQYGAQNSVQYNLYKRTSYMHVALENNLCRVRSSARSACSAHSRM